MSSVNDVLKELSAKKNEKGNLVLNRFSKKRFNELLVAMVNDVEFKERVVKKSNSESFDIEEIMVTKNFRKWLKGVVEKLGVDSHDSKVVLSNEFVIDNMNDLYDFFVAAMYEYMNVGNRFDIPAHEDFNGSIAIKEVPEKKKEMRCRNPKTGDFMFDVEITSKKHKVLSVKSTCPKYLSKKRKK